MKLYIVTGNMDAGPDEAPPSVIVASPDARRAFEEAAYALDDSRYSHGEAERIEFVGTGRGPIRVVMVGYVPVEEGDPE